MRYEEVNDLLKPGYLPFESGYREVGDGKWTVAALTRMPGCRAKMIDWWFTWLGGIEWYRLWHPTATPVTLGPATAPATYLIGFSILVAAIVGVHYLVSRTSFGRDLRGSAADASAASTLGVDVQRVQMLTFALGAACAGMGGVLIGAAFQFGPSSGAAYQLNSLTIVVLGGLGNVLGSLIGGIALGALQSVGGLALGDGYRDVVGMALFLAVLAFRPGGIGRART